MTYTHIDALAAARRRMEREIVAAREEMMWGVSRLATTAATAPLFGLLGACLGVANSFRGITGDKTTIMANLAGYLAEGIIPAAIGLAVGIAALLGYRWLGNSAEDYEVELRSVSAELLECLAHRLLGPA